MKLLISVLFLLISLCSYGQGDWQSGFIIQHSNDTLFGLIDNRDSKDNSMQCFFKKEVHSEVKVFRPNDIKGFRFADGKFYLSKRVAEKGQKNSYFLEFMVSGKLSLYHMKDDKSRYFLEKDTAIYELMNTETIVEVKGTRMLSENKEYLGQLKALMMDAYIKKEIENLAFRPKPLINITTTYHNKVCPDQECIVYTKKFAPVKVKLSIIGGAAVNKINFGKEVTSDFGVSPFLGFRFDFLNIIPWYERLSLTLDVGVLQFSSYTLSGEKGKYNYVTYKGEEYTIANGAVVFDPVKSLDVDVMAYILRLPLTLNYTLAKGKISPYISTGCLNMFMLSQSRNLFYNDFETKFGKTIPNHHIGLVGKAGVKYNLSNKKMVNFDVAYERTSTLDINEVYKFRYSSINLSIGYTF